MPELEASRTLVKSPPELWAECSDSASLGRHLGAFGEIRITKLEPETSVAWEGAEVRGTVTIEPSGWGTRVILTATPGTDPEPELAPEPIRDPSPQPLEKASPAEPGTRRPPGPFARLLRRWRGQPIVAPPAAAAPVDPPAPEPVPPPEPPTPSAELDALLGALDSLGTAHRRPFSRP